MLNSDLALFVKQMLRKPHQVSALAPSSAELSRAMAAGLGPDSGRVVEFGPGTGKITRAILDRGVKPENLTLFEMNPEFAAILRQRFPGVTVHVAGAQTAADHCAPGVDAVISGLPLLSMPSEIRNAIVGGAFSVLREGGGMVQFTYGPRPPLSDDAMQHLGLSAEKGAKVWGNLPPARVYTFRRLPH